jgi:hypothetical protein
MSGLSTGVCPDVTTCRDPRTDAAGLTGTTWPVTSQSKQMADRGEPLHDARRRELARAGLVCGPTGSRATHADGRGKPGRCGRKSFVATPEQRNNVRLPRAHRPGEEAWNTAETHQDLTMMKRTAPRSANQRHGTGGPRQSAGGGGGGGGFAPGARRACCRNRETDTCLFMCLLPRWRPPMVSDPLSRLRDLNLNVHRGGTIQVATWTGWTAPIDGTPMLAHQARNSSTARACVPGVAATLRVATLPLNAARLRANEERL